MCDSMHVVRMEFYMPGIPLQHQVSLSHMLYVTIGILDTNILTPPRGCMNFDHKKGRLNG